MLEVDRLVKVFPLRSGRLLKRNVARLMAVNGVSLSIRAGETLALVGESGCGKSTTARAVLRLVEPTSGVVRFRGEDVTAAPPRRLRELRRDMRIVFQDPSASLNPRMTVRSLLTEPFRVHGVPEDGQVADLLDLVGLDRHHGDRYPEELSGGERQRVGVARAVALEPRLVVWDEPVSALDVSIRAQVLNLLNDLQRERQLSYLFIAHDLRVVRHMASRVAVMHLGSVVETADCDALFDNPRHPYTEALLAAMTPCRQETERAARSRSARAIPGLVPAPGGCSFREQCPSFAADLTESQRRLCREEVPALVERGDGRWVACHHRPTAAGS